MDFGAAIIIVILIIVITALVLPYIFPHKKEDDNTKVVVISPEPERQVIVRNVYDNPWHRYDYVNYYAYHPDYSGGISPHFSHRHHQKPHRWNPPIYNTPAVYIPPSNLHHRRNKR